MAQIRAAGWRAAGDMLRWAAIGACFIGAITALACAQSPQVATVTPLDMPDPQMTPGATNPDISQANIGENICHKGWSTKTIRPPASYTDELKRNQLGDPRYTDKTLSHYEEDHLISLEIGGAPRDNRNLWPELYAGPCGARVKDKLEDKLHAMVCAGTIQLTEAQHAISTDWEKAYRAYVGPLPACH